jgi:hypothetical protein
MSETAATTPAAAAPDTGPDMGLVARIIGIITSPGKTFEAVVRRPRPMGVLLIVTVVMTIAAVAPQMTERGRQAALDMQVSAIERMTGQPVSDQMYQQMAQNASSPLARYTAVIGTFVWMGLLALFFTAVYWAIFNAILGGTASFKQVLGVITHSMVIMALGALAAMPFQLMAERMTMTGPFHLGALVPGLAEDSAFRMFLVGMNFFTLWMIAVIAIGLGVLYKRKASTIGIVLFLVYAALVAAGVTVFSSFMGGRG